MSKLQEFTTLQRKAGLGRLPTEVTGMTVEKALRLAISKAAQDELTLPVAVLDVQVQRLKLAQMLDTLDDDSLLLLLEGPQGGRGLMMLDSQATAALIEVQTMGKVLSAKAAVRRPTHTDSAMCETIINRSMQEFEGHLANTNSQIWATGFRYGAKAESKRRLGMMLADIDYRIFQISLDFADGSKQGQWLLVLPATGVSASFKAADSSEDWAQILGNAVCASHVEISAVLHRSQMSLNAITALKIGDWVPVPMAAVSKVLMEGQDGRAVGRANLGKQDGFRALRLMNNNAAKTGVLNEVPSQIDLMAQITPGMSNFSEIKPMAEMPPLPEIDTLSEQSPMADPLSTSDALLDMPVAPMGMDTLDIGENGGDLPDSPMAPMEELPALDGEAEPMAVMPMELEIS